MALIFPLKKKKPTNNKKSHISSFNPASTLLTGTKGYYSHPPYYLPGS
jgi:hypothetical protein